MSRNKLEEDITLLEELLPLDTAVFLARVDTFDRAIESDRVAKVKFVQPGCGNRQVVNGICSA